MSFSKKNLTVAAGYLEPHRHLISILLQMQNCSKTRRHHPGALWERENSTTGYDSPSPIPEFNNTPQENHMADDKVRASSSSSSLFTLNLPNGLWEEIGRVAEDIK